MIVWLLLLHVDYAQWVAMAAESMLIAVARVDLHDQEETHLPEHNIITFSYPTQQVFPNNRALLGRNRMLPVED